MTASEKYLPLDGIKVFELGIAIASPFCGKLMAHFGADVIKIESRTSPDVVRLLGSAWLKDREDLDNLTKTVFTLDGITRSYTHVVLNTVKESGVILPEE